MTSASRHAASDALPKGLSAVLPAHNEALNLPDVLTELAGVLRSMGRPFEILCVDDASTDDTRNVLTRLRGDALPELRIASLRENAGQSAAIGVAFRRTRHPWIVTLDADGQNDPADIPRLFDAIGDADMCCGYRVDRKDPWSKRAASRVANATRNFILRGDIRDTGCSLKLFRADMVRDVCMWKGAHRFLPDLCVIHHQARIVQIPVRHRPRLRGESNYTNHGRLGKTLSDLLAVRWMQRRIRFPDVEDID